MPTEHDRKTFKLKDLLLSRNTLLTVYILAAVIGTVAKLLLPPFESNGLHYPQLQNFAIFRNSFFHLIHRQDLYTTFPLEQFDFYKYSPTFALLMGPFAILSYGLGAIAWNLANALALFFAVWLIPGESDRRKAWVLWFVLLSLMVDIQNAQSNALIAALMLGSWVAQERDNPLASSFCMVLSVFTKLFGGLALLPCLLSRKRITELIGYSAMWTLLMSIAPLAVISPAQLIFLYRSWYARLQSDGSTHIGLSLMGVMQTWFHISIPGYIALPAGAAILILVLIVRRDAHQDFYFRLLAVSSVLIWVVIFNHMAESPTMIVAVTGVALWYFFQPASTTNRIILLISFVLTCLAPTDIVPRPLRQQFKVGYAEAAPCILVWFKVQYDLLRFPRS